MLATVAALCCNATLVHSIRCILRVVAAAGVCAGTQLEGVTQLPELPVTEYLAAAGVCTH